MGGAALIVGAGDATGGAIARAFAAEGLTACVNRRATNIDRLEALAASIREKGHQARAFPGDAREEDEVVPDDGRGDHGRRLLNRIPPEERARGGIDTDRAARGHVVRAGQRARARRRVQPGTARVV